MQKCIQSKKVKHHLGGCDFLKKKFLEVHRMVGNSHIRIKVDLQDMNTEVHLKPWKFTFTNPEVHVDRRKA